MNVRFSMMAWLAATLVWAGGRVLADDELTVAVADQPVVLREEERGTARFFSSLTSSNRWNQWHANLSSNVVQAASRMDHFFADERLNEEGNDTRINLSLGVRLKEEEDAKSINRINLRLSMPNLSRRVQLVVEDIVESDEPGRPSAVVDDITDSRPDAALRYTVKSKSKTRLSADAGVRLGSSDQVFIRLRAYRVFDIADDFQIRLTESVRWYSYDGWISQSQMQLNHWVGASWLLRSTTELEWTEYDPGVRPSQTFSGFYTFSKRRAIRLDIGGSWPETPSTQEARYFTTLTHRRLVHSNWLYFQVAPGVEFLEEHRYDPMFYVSIQFDIVIGAITE